VKAKLFLVVGPSGVGKDSVLDGARIAFKDDQRFAFVRRTITRKADAGGEEFDAVSVEEFKKLDASCAFFVTWSAHDLFYGLPVQIVEQLKGGTHVFVNVSRAALARIAGLWGNVSIVEITASPEKIAERLRARGRETDTDIAARLKRKTPEYPDGIEVITIVNNTTIDSAVEMFASAVNSAIPHWLKLKSVPIDTWRENICFLHKQGTAFRSEDYLGPGKVDVLNDKGSIRAKINVVAGSGFLAHDEIGLSTAAFEKLGMPEGTLLTLERTPSPESLAALRTKISGKTLNEKQINMIVRDISEDRYNGREISAFLVAASQSLKLDEVEALARARAKLSPKMSWSSDLVVDKHSMGGVPGSRITMIVIPIVAAHGMIIPKTSSRAITSAAGTADAMEVVARVDLSADEVREVVDCANGCIVWNGRLNHSPVDDVMNSITRPLGIDSTKWAVASILSKKLAAGSTHVIIDIPAGPGMKTSTRAEGEELAELFEVIGKRLGLTVQAMVTDASRPVGNGVGPALEVRDVYRVLRNDTDASGDLRDKVLKFAGNILEWSSNITTGDGKKRARELLENGAALEALERIIDAQGRHASPATPGVLVHEVRARSSGHITGIDPRKISRIARRAGAPADKSAGIDLLQSIGKEVVVGEPLFLVHGSTEADFQAAVDIAEISDVFDVE